MLYADCVKSSGVYVHVLESGRVETRIYHGNRGNWMWKSGQEEIVRIVEVLKANGIHYTYSEAYDLWRLYSDHCCANWMYVDSENTFAQLDRALKLFNEEVKR